MLHHWGATSIEIPSIAFLKPNKILKWFLDSKNVYRYSKIEQNKKELIIMKWLAVLFRYYRILPQLGSHALSEQKKNVCYDKIILRWKEENQRTFTLLMFDLNEKKIDFFYSIWFSSGSYTLEKKNIKPITMPRRLVEIVGLFLIRTWSIICEFQCKNSIPIVSFVQL